LSGLPPEYKLSDNINRIVTDSGRNAVFKEQLYAGAAQPDRSNSL
jgi:hypothetical protein